MRTAGIFRLPEPPSSAVQPRDGTWCSDLDGCCGWSYATLRQLAELLHEDEGQDRVRAALRQYAFWLFKAGCRRTEICGGLSDGQTHVKRNQAGVHPFMRNRGPSSLRLVRITCRIDYSQPPNMVSRDLQCLRRR